MNDSGVSDWIQFPLFFVSLAVSIITSIIFLYLGVRLLKHYDSTKRSLYILAKLFLMQIICYLLSDIGFVTYWIDYIQTNKSNDSLSHDIIECIYFTFWCIGTLILYFILILRLYYTFNETIYRIKAKIIIFFIILLLIIIIIYILKIIDLFGYIIHFKSLWIYPALIFCNFLLGGFLIYLFVKKLFAVAISQAVSDKDYPLLQDEDIQDLNDDDDDVISIQERSLKLLSLVAKLTILAILAIVSVQIYWILEGFQHLYEDYSNHGNNFNGFLQILLISRMWIRCFVIFSDIFCVYLGFAINNTLYHKICGKCQVQCESLCTKYAKTSIQSQLLQIKRHRIRGND